VSESTLYPILRRLEASNCLTVRSAEHNGRLRRYYSITQAGKNRLKEFREEWKEMISIYQFVMKGEEDEQN
ncbi:MAG: PadR family transcriptional regulator, partial [Clostridia bacterium]|nr:PadR family transcriptional regulator [Clostridia bacterium]